MSNNMRMFGILDIDSWVETVQTSLTYKMGGYDVLLMSLLSDVQEILEFGDKEEARLAINRIKYLVSTHMEDHK